MSNLARTYSGLGEHQKTKDLKISVLEKRRQILGNTHPDTLDEMSSLASTYSDLGDHQKAQQLRDSVREVVKAANPTEMII
ncbi:hypothetical protein B0H14DRAFT_2345597 [Mycena olivaceomarginata]|nr:hypothetical protein B0H14DRAFT_3599802 [Mycena olivaceomarginata]KAJ7870601.1 hypothetical protein B0H14DRAFT_2345597 [Mycena olivaceomarginata]